MNLANWSTQFELSTGKNYYTDPTGAYTFDHAPTDAEWAAATAPPPPPPPAPVPAATNTPLPTIFNNTWGENSNYTLQSNLGSDPTFTDASGNPIASVPDSKYYNYDPAAARAAYNVAQEIRGRYGITDADWSTAIRQAGEPLLGTANYVQNKISPLTTVNQAVSSLQSKYPSLSSLTSSQEWNGLVSYGTQLGQQMTASSDAANQQMLDYQNAGLMMLGGIAGGAMLGVGGLGTSAATDAAGASAGGMLGEGAVATAYPVSYAGMPTVIGTESAGGAIGGAGMLGGTGGIAPMTDYMNMFGVGQDSGLYNLGASSYGNVLPEITSWEQLIASPTSGWAEQLSSLGVGGTDLASIASGALDLSGLVQKYGQPLAKALGVTKADGSIDWAKVASQGLTAAGGLLSGNAATDAARITADAQLKAAQIAADSAKFKPVGVTSRFGTSQFGYDDKGNLTSAGYNLAPDVRAQQDTLMGMTPGLLSQYQGAQAATAPMGQAAGTMMGLGNQYLATTPEQQAQKYMAEQQALLATGRERDLSTLQNKLAQQGRMGLATGGTSTGMMAANPEMEAFYNAQRQQDLGLAAQATQGGMDYAKFGAGMVGSGGEMLNSMYGTQSAAYNPYKTAMGGASYLEGLGQQTMDAGINIGAKGTAANAQSGLLMANGITNAANTMQDVNKVSTWGNMLTDAGAMFNQYSNPQQQQQMQQQQQSYDPGKFRLVPL